MQPVNREALFWLFVIILLNLAAYMVGKVEGKREGRDMTIMILKAVAPNEMNAAIDRLNSVKPFDLATEIVRKKSADDRIKK